MATCHPLLHQKLVSLLFSYRKSGQSSRAVGNEHMDMNLWTFFRPMLPFSRLLIIESEVGVSKKTFTELIAIYCSMNVSTAFPKLFHSIVLQYAAGRRSTTSLNGQGVSGNVPKELHVKTSGKRAEVRRHPSEAPLFCHDSHWNWEGQLCDFVNLTPANARFSASFVFLIGGREKRTITGVKFTKT
eukprot:scaffold7211_cov247-Ochromonas_danica.AAC.4